MKLNVLAIVIMLAVATGLNAQDTPRASLHLFSDQFVGDEGVVLYPQYAWNFRIPTGNIGGYGFAEVAPYEPLFTNHLVVYTPSVMTWFSVHTETGGAPIKGTHFFQVGPRINVVNAIPKLKKSMNQIFIAALPRCEGVRPNNILLAGATNRFKITKTLRGSLEGYRRFFPHGAYYGEYWILVHPEKTPHFSWGMFILNDSNQKVSVGFGARISLF